MRPNILGGSWLLLDAAGASLRECAGREMVKQEPESPAASGFPVSAIDGNLDGVTSSLRGGDGRATCNGADGKRRYEEPPNVDLDTRLNNPGRRLEGKLATVIGAVDEQGGRVRLGDSEWTARGGPAQPGERVKIVSVDGNCLIVEPEAKKLPDES